MILESAVDASILGFEAKRENYGRRERVKHFFYHVPSYPSLPFPFSPTTTSPHQTDNEVTLQYTYRIPSIPLPLRRNHASGYR